MIKLHEKFIVDQEGKKSGVIINIEDYNRILDILEEYDDIKDFDERTSDPEWISYEELKKVKDV
jgi:hypothetical protein